ncbi:MAG: WD40/YVTN/BNR-like repeat-containing protein [Actinomycetota bacterium]
MSLARSVLALLFLLPVLPVASTDTAGAAPRCGGPLHMPRLRFGKPLIIDEVRAGGEPSVEGLADGTLLYAAHASTTLFKRDNMPDPDYLLPYTGVTYVWRSEDNGKTWAYVGLAGTGVGPHATVSGFSDPDFAVDKAGNVYTAGINLANVYVAKSSDAGRTWVGHPFGTIMTDREWLAADEEDVVYMNGNQIPGGRRLWKSTNGGLTFNLATPVQLPGGGPPSKIEVDKKTGRLYFPTGEGGVAVYPGARDDDFERIDAAVPGGTPHAHGFLNNMALDAAGNAYLVSNTETQVRVSYSTDGGRKWTTQVIHDAAPNTVLWPWISAGANGRVGVSWFQADRPVPDTEETDANYRVVAAQTRTGHGWRDRCGDSRPPAWQVAVATKKPFHRGTICSSGTICQVPGTDRRLGDYHTNSITAGGDFVIAYSDTEFKPESAVSKPAFVRQVGGLDFVPGKK